MGILLNYDLDDKHTQVKNSMKDKGYTDYFEYYKTVDGKEVKKRINLPNTTLYHVNKSVTGARDELKTVADSKGAKIEYCLATNFDPDTTGWASRGL